MDKQELETRIADLEQAVVIAAGRVAQTQEQWENEQAGQHQIEGRLLEASEMLGTFDDEKDE